MAPRFSVVVPVYDEEGSLPELYRRLVAVLDGLDGEWELILVDDGSRDGSFEAMLPLREQDNRVKVVRLSRRFGKEVAMTAGLDVSQGEAVIVMDADLQHPPELIPDLVARWSEGYDVVYAVMEDRVGEGPLKRSTSTLYYKMLNRLTEVDMPRAAGDFRLVDRRAVDAFSSLRERTRYMRGMFSWIGFRQTGIPYVAAPRHAGRTKFSFGGLLRLGADGVFSFSNAPLRLVLKLGFLVSALAAVELAYAIFSKATGLTEVPGWASIVIVVSFLGGIQLMVLGVIGEYVGLVYDEVKHRPIYLVRELHGFEREP